MQQRKVKELNSYYIEQQEITKAEGLRRRKGLIRRLSALFLFVMIVVISTGFTLHSQNKVLDEKLEKKELLDKKLAQLELTERDLQNEINNLNNFDYIAEIARRDYFLSNPGEIIFKVTTSSSD